MTETFEDVAILKEFTKTYPRASWSPEIYNKYKNVYNIYLHIGLHSLEGRGISITVAKANAIRKHTAIVFSAKTSNRQNKIGDSEYVMKNDAPSNYLGNTSHFAEDTGPSGIV